MTDQLKKDIKTIIEVLTFIMISVAVCGFFSEHSWICDGVIIFFIGREIYSRYYKRANKNLMVFPTLNDNYSRMLPISIGIVGCVLAVVVWLAFSAPIYKVLVVFTFGIVIFLFGFFELPKGWVSIEFNILKIYGIKESMDIRQLKEITLKNDKIILTNIYEEHRANTLLKLNPTVANNLKKFLEENLHNTEVLIINEVT
jgi:hypothetical protein